MQTLSEVVDEIVAYVVARVNITTGTREEIRRHVISKVLPLTPAQSVISFHDDAEGLKGQSAAILKLLRERRSSGAFNYELAEISLKYTSRVSDLRAAGWKISCERGEGRTTRYLLAATDW